jgi:hypothetical protein
LLAPTPFATTTDASLLLGTGQAKQGLEMMEQPHPSWARSSPRHGPIVSHGGA